jgi:hypothetical protein
VECVSHSFDGRLARMAANTESFLVVLIPHSRHPETMKNWGERPSV